MRLYWDRLECRLPIIAKVPLLLVVLYDNRTHDTQPSRYMSLCSILLLYEMHDHGLLRHMKQVTEQTIHMKKRRIGSNFFIVSA